MSRGGDACRQAKGQVAPECYFWAFVELVVNNSDYPDWAAFDKSARSYIR